MYICLDDHFVPNLTFGPMMCKSLRECGIQHDIDVHLMVEHVDAMIHAFAECGASYITFHPEVPLFGQSYAPITANTLLL